MLLTCIDGGGGTKGGVFASSDKILALFGACRFKTSMDGLGEVL